MNKILTYITAAIASLLLVGCTTFNKWFSNVDWEKVNTVVLPVVEQTAKTTVYLVCEKNPDLKPIFVAAGNGLLLAVANEAFDPTQIKDYIKQGLGDEADKYYAVVIAGMDALINGYTTFYNINWKSSGDVTEQANIEAVFSKYIATIATGVIDGAKLSTEQYNEIVSIAKSKINFKDVNKIKVIK